MIKQLIQTLPVLATDLPLLLEIINFSKGLEKPSKKRMLFIAYTSILTLKDFDRVQRLKQAQLVALVFYLDYLLDEVFPKNNLEDYKKQVDHILERPEVIEKLNIILDDLDSGSAQQLASKFQEFCDSSAQLHSLTFLTVEDYLQVTEVSIGVPLCTALVSILSDEAVNDSMLKLAARIVRLGNDGATQEKDRQEGTPNSYNLFPKNEIDLLLQQLVEQFDHLKFTNSAPDVFLRKLVEITRTLYTPGKDFEL